MRQAIFGALMLGLMASGGGRASALPSGSSSMEPSGEKKESRPASQGTFRSSQPGSAPTPKPLKRPPANPTAEDLYHQGRQSSDNGDYAGALPYFERANEKRPDDPEILNMLAFTQRKTGNLKAAIANYHKALELRPRFPEAREYIGEAYVEAALEQIRLLESYGDEGLEGREELVEALKNAAAGLKE